MPLGFSSDSGVASPPEKSLFGRGGVSEEGVPVAQLQKDLPAVRQGRTTSPLPVGQAGPLPPPSLPPLPLPLSPLPPPSPRFPSPHPSAQHTTLFLISILSLLSTTCFEFGFLPTQAG